MVEWGHQKVNNSLNKGLKPNKNKKRGKNEKTTICNNSKLDDIILTIIKTITIFTIRN
jgi:hypothetical protein